METPLETGMKTAILQAMRSDGEIPVGVAIFDLDGRLLSSAHNNREASHDPSGHAEIIALRQACGSLENWRLFGAHVFITLEPCVMCAGALREARVSNIAFGAYSPVGAAGTLYDILRDERLGKVPEVIPGVLEEECRKLTQNFFIALRAMGENIGEI